MPSSTTITTDKLRLLYSLLFLCGSIFAVIVSLRVLREDQCLFLENQNNHLINDS